MARHLLLLVHGMGIHDDSWISGDDGPVEALEGAARRYVYFQQHPLEQQVEFVPISYDRVFRNIVTQWQANATSVTSLPNNTLGSALGWLSNAGATEKNFWWTHVADVALYRCFPTYREAVRAAVMDAVVTAITPRVGAGDTNLSVLAHSLGTSVMHDTLHILGSRQTLGGKPNAFIATNFRFENVIMVANVSRLLQTDDADGQPVYKSIVRPGKRGQADSYCQRYLNFRHEADPFTFPRMFDPEGWDPQRYKNELIRHYWQPNIHDVSHYLLNPRVHIPILRALTTQKAITPDEAHAAINPDHFPQIGGSFDFAKKVTALAERFESLKQKLGENPTTAVITEAFAQYASAVQEAA